MLQHDEEEEIVVDSPLSPAHGQDSALGAEGSQPFAELPHAKSYQAGGHAHFPETGAAPSHQARNSAQS